MIAPVTPSRYSSGVENQGQPLKFHNAVIERQKHESESDEGDGEWREIIFHIVISCSIWFLMPYPRNHQKKAIRAIRTTVNNSGPAQGYFSFLNSSAFMSVMHLPLG